MVRSRTKRGPRSHTIFSRDVIGVEQLQSLKERFADGDLTETEFVNLFREIVDASLNETQLAELFQKIDANSDGTVDWDELTNYMFLNGSGTDEFIDDEGNLGYETTWPETFMSDHSHRGKPFLDESGSILPTEVMGNVVGGTLGLNLFPRHKDDITRIVRLERPSVYLTTSKDGSIRTWSTTTLAPQQVLASGKDWLTDCCVMKRSNRLVVSSMNRTLSFYDLNSGQLIGSLVDYSRRQRIPLCLAYVEKPSDENEAVVIGDDTGGISVFTCSNQWLACDGRSPPAGLPATDAGTLGSSAGLSGSTGSTTVGTGTPSPSMPALSTTAIGSAALESQGFSSRAYFQKHTDWITRVKWVHDMRAVVAASLDTTVSILDVERLVVKFEYARHRKGVFDVAWCANTRLIASCGMEREIHIWNPYSSQRALATLKGHTSSVLHLVSDDDKFQIVSTSADHVVKVWDVRNHRCLQTFSVDRHRESSHLAEVSSTETRASLPCSSRNENDISALFFDGKVPCLMTGSMQLTRWTVKTIDGGQFQSAHDVDASAVRQHRTLPLERPVHLSCYNQVFHQVVTASMTAESTIKTWSVETGDEISGFTRAHDAHIVTSIAFDYAGRRLLTGSHNGEQLKMWNFSNGSLIKRFHKTQASIVRSQRIKTTLTSGVSVSFHPSGRMKSAEDTATVITASRQRKTRDIAVLPASFGIDSEGKCHKSASSHTDLPSPTRIRLERGLNHPTLSQRPCSKTEEEERNQERQRSSPVSRASRPCYSQHEVTSMIYSERNVRVGKGDVVCQRFVSSVGWDRQVYVWTDTKDESEALPVHVLPRDSGGCEDGKEKSQGRHGRQYHTMDVLTLVHIPPAYVATAGLDGLVLVWSLPSGELVASLPQHSGAIESLYYAEKLDLLFGAGERGMLLCFDRSLTLQATIPLDIQLADSKDSPASSETITTLQCDKANTHLFSGDAAGYVKVWELRVARNHRGIDLAFVCAWRLGTGSRRRIICIDFVENLPRVSELFLVLSCADGDVSVWTLDGIHIGSFGGRHSTWQLGDPSTYASSRSYCEWKWHLDHTVDKRWFRDDQKPPHIVLQSPPSVFIKSCTMKALTSSMSEVQDKTFLLEDTMPKAGEVWICVSAPKEAKKQEDATVDSVQESRFLSDSPCSEVTMSTDAKRDSKLDETNSLSMLPYLQQQLAQVDGQVTDVLTIVKVTRGEISGWDATTSNPLRALKVLDMRDFGRNPGWSKHTLLSQFIGRTFLEDNVAFRVTAIVMHAMDSTNPDKKKSFALIDSEANEHPVQPLNESISSIRLNLLETFRKEQTLASSAQIDPPYLPSCLPTSSHKARTKSTIGSPLNPRSSLREPMTHVPLPLIRRREKRAMGGLVPKRSMIRSQLDPTADIRRIHKPDEIPKNFRTMLQQSRDKETCFTKILP